MDTVNSIDDDKKPVVQNECSYDATAISDNINYPNDRVIARNNNGIEEDSNVTNTINGLANSETSLFFNSMYDVVEENKNLKLLLEKLQKDNAILESDNSKDLHVIQVEALEKTIAQQKSEIERLHSNIRQQTEISQKEIIQLKEENNSKFEKLLLQCEQASKEKESMVMKYAVSENSVIQLQRQLKNCENKLKEQQKEKESLEAKINQLNNDKLKQSQVINSKNNDIMGLERELQKKKDELHSQSSNLKFFQNKLKLEMESHKESQLKLEKTTQKLKEAKEETEQIRKDGQAMLHKYETEGRKVLELQDAEELTTLQTELGSLIIKNNDLLEENNKLYEKIQVLESEGIENEDNLHKLQQSKDNYENLQLDLQSVEKELKSHKLLLERERQRYEDIYNENEELRQTSVDLHQEMEKCRERDAELLSFTQMLTEKNVSIQSELTGLDARVKQQELELSEAKELITNLTKERNGLKEELERERNQRNEEKSLLSKHLKERTLTAEKLSKQLEDQIGETQLLKKKHLASIKELNRELQLCRRRGETLELNSISQGSRTSSNSSLNIEPIEQKIIPGTEPDRQLLIEKIVKVQRSNARKQEKLEFLEGHSNQLLLELKRKSKIIQSLIMKQQTGALVSESMDANKAELIKHKGIMASVYSSKPIDEALTLELSLEMNRKLQAVLEDTLLKNITLKENMETLGNEIARLTSKPFTSPNSAT